MPLGLGCGQGKSCVSRQSSVLSNLSLPLRWPLQPQLHGAPRLCPRCSSQVGRDISAPSGPTGPTSNVTHVNCWSQEDPCYCIAAPNGRDLHCPGLRPSRPFRLHSVASSATQPPAIEDFPTLLTCMHGMVTNCMHGTVLTCLSHSAAKQSSAGGKRGSKGRHGIDTVFSGGAAAPSGLGSIRRLVAVGFPQCLLRHEHSNSREGR